MQTSSSSSSSSRGHKRTRRGPSFVFQWIALTAVLAVVQGSQTGQTTSKEQRPRQAEATTTTSSSHYSARETTASANESGDKRNQKPPLLDVLSQMSGGAASSKASSGAAGGGAQCLAPCAQEQSVSVPREASLRPYSNGCSVPVMFRDSLPNYHIFEACCDLHDACYMACGIAKTTCDASFAKCMQSTCPVQQELPVAECTGMANLFAKGVELFGCAGYQSLQKEGCECLSVENDDATIAEIRMEAYVEAFYQVYNTTHPEPPPMARNYLSQGPDKWGTLIYALYQKYPQSIHIISRDGQSSRSVPSYFQRIEKDDE